MDDKIKYYSFNIEESSSDKININEGLDGEIKADYQGTEYNTEKLNEDPLSFGDKYYDTILSLKEKYNELMQATISIERDNTNDANDIFNIMEENRGDDQYERSAVLEHLNYGKYSKEMINLFINKVKNKYENNISDFEINNIE